MKRHQCALLVALVGLLICGEVSRGEGAATNPDGSFIYTNRLAKEKSPYLLQHAHNPVDWYPWGAEAFEKAKKEDKPIFLSIGYSTCHWCHVMERECFEDPKVAKLINDNFVPIKVDREERPDVDRVYMAFVQATTGGGGWPMTVLLTPDLKPFFGGTYFPPEDHDGSPGLKTLIARVHEAWTTDHAKVLEFSEKFTKALRDSAEKGRGQSADVPAAVLAMAAEQFAKDFDEQFGGFGDSTKFPQPVTLNFLFHFQQRSGQAPARDMALKTLRAMAQGGMHDQLGGGFHRYSTDRRWFLPHFEKMLYDQAQLACAYLDAYQVTRDAYYADVARDVLDYVLHDMTGPEGQFYSAEDADSAIDAKDPAKKGEGAFYVWRTDEIEQVIGKGSAALFAYRYGVEPDGNVSVDPRGEFPKKNVLFVAHSIEETAKKFGKSEAQVRDALDGAKRGLLDARNRRPRPHRDDKALCAWNGLMISAFARGGRELNEPRYAEAAERAAKFIETKLYDAKERKLIRRWRDGQADVDGFLDDYAFLIQGLLDLYENGQDVRWLKWAIEVQSEQDARFLDEKAGGYFLSPAGDATLLVRQKEEGDGAEPGGNSVAALNLLRLAQMTDDKAMAERAGAILRLFSGRIMRYPMGMAQMLVAVDFRLAKPRQIVIAGRRDAPDTQAMLNLVARHYLANKVVLLADGAEGQAFLVGHVAFLKDVKPIDGKATAYVCENYACQLPTTDFGQLEKLLNPPSGEKAK
ncbi:MAG TPA: thioredoxin domain-containing protein [Tepidisphaeraceae bacterium]|jgi:hypothetical protein|nr:thioredoxin domain-containing protein [Tepidisphaeraceae bacterium]